MTIRSRTPAAIRWIMLALALLCALVSAASLAMGSTTPPASGDWTIESWESAVLEGGTTVVSGNITVNGALYLGNGTLELDPPTAGVAPRLVLNAGATLEARNAVVQAGPGPADSFTVDCDGCAAIAASQSTFARLGSMTKGNASFVGFHIAGAAVTFQGVSILASRGGLGFDGGARLVASGLTVQVGERALVATGGSSVTVTGFSFSGDLGGSDYLVVAERSPISLTNGTVTAAATGMFLLSCTAVFSNVTVDTVGDVGILLLSADLTYLGGAVAPHARAGIEAYQSTISIESSFYNFTYGLVLINSKASIARSVFEASDENPKGSFTGIYGFGADVQVADSKFDGTYHVTDIPLLDANGQPVFDPFTGLPVMVPLFACSQSAFWMVHSLFAIDRANTTCFNEHVHGEESDLVFRQVSMVNGTTGMVLFRGTVQGAGLSASLMTNPTGTAVALTLYQTSGTVSDYNTTGSDVGVDFIDSDARVEGLIATPPGLGVRVTSGTPTVADSVFGIHNATSVLVLAGSPTIVNNTFWISADRQPAHGVFVQAGAPLITGNRFHGTYALTYGVRGISGAARVVGNEFDTLERGVVFYSEDFLIEGNLFTRCWNGAESREFSAGVIRGNLFRDLTDVGAGTGINLYYASTLVEGNSFLRVNYGVKVFEYAAGLPDGTRVAGNDFDTVEWYAIEVWNATKSFLIDNNTIRNASHGGIELYFSTVAASYNVNFDGQRYGYDLTYSNITITGDRLENVTEAIHANRSGVTLYYTTIARTHLGLNVQDGPAMVYNASFQFNGIAVEIVNNRTNEIVDSIFVGNTMAIAAFSSAHIEVRDSSFIGTLGGIVDNGQSSTAHILFTRRGELNGGLLRLRGTLESTAPAFTMRSLKVSFFSSEGSVPGVSIRGASLLALTNVDFSNSSSAFSFEIADSTGSFSQVNLRRVTGANLTGTQGPVFSGSTLALRDISIVDSFTSLTLVNTSWGANNLTVRDARASGVVMANASITGTSVVILDNAYCGVNASAGSSINVTNLTVRGNRGGGMCVDSSRGEVWNGDFSNTGVDLALNGSSEVRVVSTNIVRGWSVNDTAILTIAWLLSVHVSYANPSQLPSATVSVADAKGLAFATSPDTFGNTTGLPPFTERTVTATAVDMRSPYMVTVVLGAASASQSVALTQDRLVQLDLTDSTPPQVAILAPADGAGFAASLVSLRFEANDTGSAIKELQYRFGAGALSAVPPSAGPIEFTRDLVDGSHTFTVIATDFAGNEAEVSVNFTVDTQAPLIIIVGPKPSPFSTRATSITVQVTVEPDVTNVTIGGVAIPMVASGASRVIDVPEGRTQIVIEAVDRVGNRANVTVEVVADRTPPSLVIDNAGGQNLTIESFAVVRGRAEPGSLVLIGGFPVATENGAFEALVMLAEGRNEIEVRARDALGNENISKVTLTRGIQQPSHILDPVALLVGAGLLIAAAAAAFVTFGRESARSQERASEGSGRKGGSP